MEDAISSGGTCTNFGIIIYLTLLCLCAILLNPVGKLLIDLLDRQGEVEGQNYLTLQAHHARNYDTFNPDGTIPVVRFERDPNNHRGLISTDFIALGMLFQFASFLIVPTFYHQNDPSWQWDTKLASLVIVSGWACLQVVELLFLFIGLMLYGFWILMWKLLRKQQVSIMGDSSISANGNFSFDAVEWVDQEVEERFEGCGGAYSYDA